MFCQNCGKDLGISAEICFKCGEKPPAGNRYCHVCGTKTDPLAEVCVRCGNKLPKPGALEISPKSRLAVALLAIFLGFFGVHRFYLDKSASAVIMLVLGIAGWCTMWLLGAGLLFLIAVYLWALVDCVITVSGRMQDGAGRAVKNW